MKYKCNFDGEVVEAFEFFKNDRKFISDHGLSKNNIYGSTNEYGFMIEIENEWIEINEGDLVVYRWDKSRGLASNELFNLNFTAIE